MKRNYSAAILTIIWIILFTAASVSVSAEDKAEMKKPETITVTGLISAVYDDDYNVMKVVLKDEKDKDKIYNVTLDDNGRILGEIYNDEKVTVTGTLTEKNNEKWLKVQEYKMVFEERDLFEEMEETPEEPLMEIE